MFSEIMEDSSQESMGKREEILLLWVSLNPALLDWFPTSEIGLIGLEGVAGGLPAVENDASLFMLFPAP